MGQQNEPQNSQTGEELMKNGQWQVAAAEWWQQNQVRTPQNSDQTGIIFDQQVIPMALQAPLVPGPTPMAEADTLEHS